MLTHLLRTEYQLRAAASGGKARSGAAPLQFLCAAKEIAHGHHEKWDGTGYPEGIAGDAVPIAARVYKAPMSFAEARDIIAAARGRHFDPDICDAFLSGFDEFVAIAMRYHEASVGEAWCGRESPR